jgi:hypothetical protein
VLFIRSSNPPNLPRGATSVAPSFFTKNHNQQSVGQTSNHIFRTTSDSQKRFNQYPVRAFKPDTWRGLSKEDKRNSAIALTYSFLVGGGQITKAPEKKRTGGPAVIFGKDTKAVKAHEKWSRKFYSGDDFTQKGPRFTSKPVPENSAAKRDTERKGGTSHAEFSGSVVDINGKLQARKESHATTEYLVDLVSDDALTASAERDGGRHSQKIVQLIEDSADDVTDANRRATIRDDDNLNGVDHSHNKRLKLAA